MEGRKGIIVGVVGCEETGLGGFLDTSSEISVFMIFSLAGGGNSFTGMFSS